MTGWNAQVGGGKYSIQFETNRKDLYKVVEKACQTAMDNAENAMPECDCAEKSRPIMVNESCNDYARGTKLPDTLTVRY